MVAVSDDTDDWFERALDDEETDEERTPPTPEAEPTASDGSAGDDAGKHDADTESNSTREGDVAEATDDDDPLFEEEFGDALQDVDAPMTDAAADGAATSGPEGFDDLDFVLGGSDEPDFDEEIDSELSRLELGIEGLDRMIQGGVPERSLIVTMGSAGTGKTTFGLQFLTHGLEQGERAVFITLEESRDRVINSATEKGYAFDEYVADGQLAVVDVDPIEMANSLASIRNELPTLVEEFDASRLVLDSVSLLEMMYEDRAKRRNEIYDFSRSLKEAGVTALLTSEASEETPYASRYGIVEYLTDAVFVLQYVRPDDFRETRMAIEIQKIRDANHSREKKPYEITADGISVYQQANLF
ncbi:KaiC domain-containing protein [Natrinema longum]|uniref:KaiC domain-containing protein n=1 Tax=Natrinema longum TaxID=370324 RepID=A0A8A2U3W1_9EURY|nr:KaiC domain-containing protein [Natrinema longum]MBZ6495021.1 KaiC domain-containing protein [Natrinema longum]QSW83684.1 KaiC domain-containing protein [Natrinema longum]